MALRGAVERFINDRNGPKAVFQPSPDLKSRPLSITKSPSGPSPSRRDQSVISSPVSNHQSTNPSSSPTRSVQSSADSRSSYTATAPSDSVGSLAGSLATMSMGDLPCLLREITGCPAAFDPSEVENWYDHSVSHYFDRSLPTHAMCIFCDLRFESRNPTTCWRKRMYHIAEHFEADETLERSRPDFNVIKDMREKGCISEEVYKMCFRYTERPPCEGLRSHDYIPEKIMKKQKAADELANRIPVPESRQEKREWESGKRTTVARMKKSSKPKTIVK